MLVMTDRTGIVLTRTQERIAELEAFTATHRRLPASRGPMPGEIALYEWMAAHRKLKGAHPVVLALVAHYGTRTDQQRQRVHELSSFVATHGRAPRRSTSYTKAENALAAWTVRALTNPELAAQVTEILKPYGVPLQPPSRADGTRSPAADRRIEQLRAFVTAYGHAPRHGATDPEERSLYTWLHRPSRLKTPEPEITEILGPPTAPVDRVVELEQFVDTHRRLPGPSGAERDLYRWLTVHAARRTADPRVTDMVERYRAPA